MGVGRYAAPYPLSHQPIGTHSKRMLDELSRADRGGALDALTQPGPDELGSYGRAAYSPFRFTSVRFTHGPKRVCVALGAGRTSRMTSGPGQGSGR
jgi:hypothetical protein